MCYSSALSEMLLSSLVWFLAPISLLDLHTGSSEKTFSYVNTEIPHLRLLYKYVVLAASIHCE